MAHFENAPQVAFGDELPVQAIRRLLEGTEAEPDGYTLQCDHDLAGSGILLWPAGTTVPMLGMRRARCLRRVAGTRAVRDVRWPGLRTGLRTLLSDGSRDDLFQHRCQPESGLNDSPVANLSSGPQVFSG